MFCGLVYNNSELENSVVPKGYFRTQKVKGDFMSRDYNSEAFTPEEVKKGLHLKLLNTLLDISKELKDSYYDIHLTTDGYCLILEWTDVMFDSKYGPEGKFEYVPDDGYVMIEKVFPDNHTELCYSEEDYQERLDEFLKENPGWVKGQFGRWTNEIENEHYRKLFEQDKEKVSDDQKVE